LRRALDLLPSVAEIGGDDMENFTAKGALLAGCDLIRRRPLLILLWVVLFLALDLATLSISEAFRVWRGSGLAGRASYPVLRILMAYNTVMIVLSLVVQAVLWTSAFRAYGRAPSPLGWKDFVAAVSWTVVQLIVTLATVALTVMLTEQVIRAGGPIAVGPALRAPSAVTGAIGLYWAAVAGVWAFARGEIALLRCWTMMRGRFWTVTGLVAGLAVIAYGLRAAIRPLIGLLNPHGPPVTLQGLVESPAIFVTLAGTIITVLQMVFVAGIVVSAYRARQAPGVRGVAEPVPEPG
jgi:hypothetical protein